MTNALKCDAVSIDVAQDFTQQEADYFNGVLAPVRRDISGRQPLTQHRIILGLACECVDLAAQVAADHLPGVRVVELTLLAARLCCLARSYED